VLVEASEGGLEIEVDEALCAEEGPVGRSSGSVRLL
jgi:hypothetical protein